MSDNRKKPVDILEGAGHLVVRQDHILCTVCLEMVPVHPGDGTPLPSLLFGYRRVATDHPGHPHSAGSSA